MRVSAARTGNARESTAASATIIAAEAMKTARQEIRAAMKLATGRASMIPIMSPLDTIPTTRPRVASGARCAASGTRICIATEPRPIAPAQTRNTAAEGANAAAASATALKATEARASLRFSIRSPSGTMNMQPGAVADLRHRHDEPGGLRRKAKRLRDRPDQRLGIIDIGDDEAAGRGEQENRAGRNLRRRRRQLRRLHMIQ